MSIRKLLLVLLVIPAAVSAQNYMDNPMVRIAMDTYAAQIQENPDDYMPDHTAVSRLVFDASFAATLPNYKSKYSKPAKLVPIYYMDTLAGVNFQPTEYVDISEEKVYVKEFEDFDLDKIAVRQDIKDAHHLGDGEAFIETPSTNLENTSGGKSVGAFIPPTEISTVISNAERATVKILFTAASVNSVKIKDNFEFYIDGKRLEEIQDLDIKEGNPGAMEYWQWKDTSLGFVDLEPGAHLFTVKMVAQTGAINADCFKFDVRSYGEFTEHVDDVDMPDVNVTASGVKHTLEAEDLIYTLGASEQTPAGNAYLNTSGWRSMNVTPTKGNTFGFDVISGAAASATGYLNAENYLDELLRDYYLHTSSGDYKFALSSYRLYLDGNSSEYSVSGMTEELANALWQSISQSNFAVLTLNYTRGEHSFTMRYVARITFSGNRDFRSVDEEDYFTGYEYTFIRPYVYDMEGNSLASVTIRAAKYASLDSNEVLNNMLSARAVSLSLSGQQYSMIFSQTGKYRLTYTFTITLSSTDSISFALTQDIYVLDGQGEVTITYVTDADHPFSDEMMRDAVDYTFADGSKGYAYTKTYSLLQVIQSLSSTDFAKGKDIFFGWSMEENGSARAASVISAGYSITDFISRFGDCDPVVYAIWDPGITVTAEANGQTQQRTLYMNSSGVYVVDFSSFQALAPSGYNFVGWTGGFLGQSIVTGRYTIEAVDYDDPDLTEYLTITAEFRERLLVSYSIDSQYSNSFFLREEVNDGYYVSGVKTPVAKDGYTFVGWHIAVVDNDGTITDIGEIFDLANDTVDSELCNSTGTAIGSTYKMLQLVAVFEDAEGNEVW